ncbi:MAG TPA: hypothetical protein VEX38_05860 [Fimbriimonadaceae bacterium]|nr:hypothetical protein [Fimbriimonadaceae bacterium]
MNGFLAYAGGDELGGNPTLAVPTGQCNDFGDFLTCMMQSHGIAAVAYRSYEMSKVYWGGAYGENSGWNILTNVFKKAGGESLSATFTYHQFAGLGPTVYDGAVGPATLAYQPVVGLPAALYKSILIQEFLYWHNHVRINPHPIPDPWGPVIVTVTPTVHPNPQSLF